MSYADEAKAIEARFTTQWAAATPIEYDNVQYTPTPGTNYVRLEIHDGEAVQASLGDTYLQRNVGVISVNVFTGRGTGSREGRVLADSAAAIFRRWSGSGITCHMPYITRIGPVGEWFVYNMTVAFYRDEAFSA